MIELKEKEVSKSLILWDYPNHVMMVNKLGIARFHGVINVLESLETEYRFVIYGNWSLLGNAKTNLQNLSKKYDIELVEISTNFVDQGAQKILNDV